METPPSILSLIFISGYHGSVSHLKQHFQASWTHLGGEFVVPLNELIIVSGPVGNGVVHLEHTGVAGLEDWREALHHFAAEGFPVDPFPKVQLLRGDLTAQTAPEVAVAEEVSSEDELAEFNLFVY